MSALRLSFQKLPSSPSNARRRRKREGTIRRQLVILTILDSFSTVVAGGNGVRRVARVPEIVFTHTYAVRTRGLYGGVRKYHSSRIEIVAEYR
jgi:hypothetical protein